MTRRGRTTCRVRGVTLWEGEEARKHPKERSWEGKRLVGYFEEGLDWKHLKEMVCTHHKEGRHVQRRHQDWKLSS